MSITSTAHTRSSTSSRSGTRRVLRHGVLAGVVALPVIEAYAALAKAAGIPLKAGLAGTDTAALVTAGSFATGIVIATFWGTVLAIILTRYVSRPVRTFTIIAAAATALSLITPLDAFGASLNTKLTLAGGHLIVAGIMTTILRRGLSHPQS
ncbi:MAG: DUF6069 family protein [Solirubrobacteraceae bacterium]